jgi:hypothetical protein
MFNNMTKSLLGLGLTLAVFGTAQAYPVSAQLEIRGNVDDPPKLVVPMFLVLN